MKKMNKTYEAPVAEMIEVMNAAVLMASPGGGTGAGGGNPVVVDDPNDE